MYLDACHCNSPVCTNLAQNASNLLFSCDMEIGPKDIFIVVSSPRIASALISWMDRGRQESSSRGLSRGRIEHCWDTKDIQCVVQSIRLWIDIFRVRNMNRSIST